MPDKQNYITLQLSVPALERLMQECPELVLKLSQGVMEEFARRQVRAFADSAFKDIVKKVIESELGTMTSSYNAPLKLNPQFEAALKGVVSTQIAALKTELLVDAAGKAAAVSIDLRTKIEAFVNREVTAQVAQYIRTQVTTRLKTLMESV
jgi:phage tail sheath gpL-like